MARFLHIRKNRSKVGDFLRLFYVELGSNTFSKYSNFGFGELE
jgi:hypothetical protein